MVMNDEEIRKFLNLKKEDLLIPEPREIGILGNNIYEDTLKMIEYLNLTSEFDVEKVKKLERNKTR